MRRWAYETFGADNVLQFVVMATPDDLQANAEFIRMAHQVWWRRFDALMHLCVHCFSVLLIFHIYL